MTSTNFMIGTGFIKCIPITYPGLLVTAAILVMEIEDVLVARIQLAVTDLLSCLNIFNFSSTFSVAASITKSASRIALVRSV